MPIEKETFTEKNVWSNVPWKQRKQQNGKNSKQWKPSKIVFFHVIIGFTQVLGYKSLFSVLEDSTMCNFDRQHEEQYLCAKPW
jgi:hypothetical protein